MNRITLSGNVRQQVGTKNAAQLRRVKRVPCVLYGGAGTVHFSVDEAALRKVVFTRPLALSCCAGDVAFARTPRCAVSVALPPSEPSASCALAGNARPTTNRRRQMRIMARTPKGPAELLQMDHRCMNSFLARSCSFVSR